MGISKKLEEAKQSYLLLCQQYSRMGELRAGEMQAMIDKDMEGYEAAAISHNDQFQEMGSQLIVLGRSIDSLGGVPVLKAPEAPR